MVIRGCVGHCFLGGDFANLLLDAGVVLQLATGRGGEKTFSFFASSISLRNALSSGCK